MPTPSSLGQGQFAAPQPRTGYTLTFVCLDFGKRYLFCELLTVIIMHARGRDRLAAILSFEVFFGRGDAGNGVELKSTKKTQIDAK